MLRCLIVTNLLPAFNEQTKEVIESFHNFDRKIITEDSISYPSNALIGQSNWEDLSMFLQHVANFNDTLIHLRKSLVDVYERYHFSLFLTIDGRPSTRSCRSFGKLYQERLASCKGRSLTVLRKYQPYSKEAKAKWNQSRLAYDASTKKFELLKKEKAGKESSKLKEVEAETFALRASFENLDRETMHRMDNAIGEF